jgi:uncharacterized protein (TIGR03437 family)
MIRGQRVVSFFLSYLLLVSPGLLVPTGAYAHGVNDKASKRARDPEKTFKEKLLRHQLIQQRLSKEGRLAAERAAVTDTNDIAVIKATPELVTQANFWDLNGRAILFTPAAGGGYTVSQSSIGFDTNFGTKLNIAAGINPNPQADPGDDGYVLQDVGFSFPFYGTTYTNMAISSNGNLSFRPAGMNQATFDDAASDSGETISNMQTQIPRIAPYWHDLDARPSVTTGDRGVYFRRDATRTVITWNRVRDFANSSSDNGEATAQAILFPDGRIVLAWQNAILSSTALVGIGPGRAGSPDVVNFITPPAGTFTNAIVEFFSVSTTVDDFGVIKAFFDSRKGGPNYDFVYLITDFESDLGDAFAFYLPIRNDIQGIGDRVRNFDPDGSIFGNTTIQGYLNLSNLVQDFPTGYPDLPTTRFLGSNSGLSVMGQEQGHRWNTFVTVPGTNRNLVLGRDNQHWSFFANTESTLSTPAARRSSNMEGNVWIDNNNGTFVTTGLIDGYNRYDQYLMGLRPSTDLQPMWVIDSPTGTIRTRESNPRPNSTASGTRRNVTIADVISANGARVPDWQTAPKTFNVAWVYVTNSTGAPSATQIAKVNRYRLAWESYFSQSTDYLAKIDSALSSGTEDRRIGVTSGADLSPAVAPGAIATIFGQNLSASRFEAAGNTTTLGNLQVFVNGTAAQLYLVAPGQINFVMPRSTNSTSVVPGGTVQSATAFIEVMRGGELIRAGTVQVAPNAPQIFSSNGIGTGPGAITDAFNFTGMPIAARQANGNPNIIAIFATGIGADATDTATNAAGDMQARVNGQSARVEYAGRSGYPGMNQVNVTLPAGLSAGTYDVQIIRNGIVSNTVQVTLR